MDTPGGPKKNPRIFSPVSGLLIPRRSDTSRRWCSIFQGVPKDHRHQAMFCGESHAPQEKKCSFDAIFITTRWRALDRGQNPSETRPPSKNAINSARFLLGMGATRYPETRCAFNSCWSSIPPNIAAARRLEPPFGDVSRRRFGVPPPPDTFCHFRDQVNF